MSLFDSGIRPAIDAHLAEKAAQKRDYGKYWSASSAGYCMRLNILKRLDIPPVPEIADDQARTTRVFESGHIFHEWVQRITKDAGLSIAQELELQDEDLLVRGHIDDLVLISKTSSHSIKPDVVSLKGFPGVKDGTEVTLKKAPQTLNILETDFQQNFILYDYKTANSQSFNYKRPEMSNYHKMQLGTYLYMLRKFDPQKGYKDGDVLINGKATQAQLHGLTEARILTISKDDLRMREQQIFWSSQLEKTVVEYWKTLEGYWKSKTLPKCTCLDFDGGFMGRRSSKGKIYNPYFLDGAPCADAWIQKHKELLEGWTL